MSIEKEVIYTFIDSQNLNLGVKNDLYNKKGVKFYTGWKLDFKKFYFYLRTKYNVSKAILFIGKVEGNEPLYSYLTSVGYEIEYKPTLIHINNNGDPETKGNVDAELVLRTMIELNNFDKAIIVAGDGDYFCLINYLEKVGKLFHIIIPNKYRYSKLLKPFRKYMVFVTDLKSSLK
ncbi:MAG: NYN domain-containing protein [Candidatus Methanofastidiosa archaeon]|nr:NYN domain-containing protein [Candidatus Methanofastidiosa archaeon]